MTKPWQSHKEHSTPMALSLIRWIASNLGRPTARTLLYPITLYYFIFATEQRKASYLYLQRVLGYKPTWLHVNRHIHCFASTILDRIFLLSGQFDKLDISFPDINLPLQVSQKGKGCILLGSHIGSFEVLRSYAVKKCPLPLKILMDEEHNPMLLKMLNALNSDVSKMIIQLGEPDSLIQIKETVDSGYAVCMLGDRIMDQNSKKTARCVFLKGEIELPTAPVLIAASLKAPIVVFFGIYKGGNQYEIHFELLAENINLGRENRQQEIQSILQRYAQIMEKYIKKSPYNWFNFYEYWLEE